MPISAIVQQPDVNQLLAAYRPVLIKVEATATGGGSTPPVVHCDIYFNGKFYKSISKTVFSDYLGASTRWSFDLQDACQEFLTKMIAPVGGSAVFNATGAMAKVFCRLRSSGLDLNGFTVSEGTPPVQGTLLTQPIAGTGTLTNTFYVVNAVLQHRDNQNFAESMGSYKTGSWQPDTIPLTRRPHRLPINLESSDYFPIATPGCFANIRLNYKYIGQNTVRQELRTVGQPCDGVIDYIDGFPDPGGGSITISWTSTGNVIGYEYSVDAGPAIQTTDESIVLSGLSAGAHAFVIKPLCDCGNGTEVTLNFTIA